MIVCILIGLTLIVSTFIGTVSMVQKIAYAQVRTQPSSNGVHVANSMTLAPTVVGRNSAAQGVAGALSSIHTTSTQIPGCGFCIGGIYKFIQHKDNPIQEPVGPFVILIVRS
jgi:hypothetical protein